MILLGHNIIYDKTRIIILRVLFRFIIDESFGKCVENIYYLK